MVMTPHLTISTGELTALRVGTTAIVRPDAVIRVAGPGAEACLQGILTNDIVKGHPALAWGAVLTPKGMLITDCWLRRTAEDFLLIVPPAGREALLGVLARSFPPRLAKVTDVSDHIAAWWIVGEPPREVPGVDVALPVGPAPFAALAIAECDRGADALEASGCAIGPSVLGDALAILDGWPSVGREIDEKTLPQEVRFDELEGVKYDKGCYVGQETVARLHFRGHANRTLRAMRGVGDLPEGPAIISAAGKEVGTVATLLKIGPMWVATAKVRREVATGDEVTVGGHAATVEDFPVSLDAA